MWVIYILSGLSEVLDRIVAIQKGRARMCCNWQWKPITLTPSIAELTPFLALCGLFYVSVPSIHPSIHLCPHSFESRINQLHLSSTQLIFGKQSAVNQLLWQLGQRVMAWPSELPFNAARTGLNPLKIAENNVCLDDRIHY